MTQAVYMAFAGPVNPECVIIIETGFRETAASAVALGGWCLERDGECYF